MTLAERLHSLAASLPSDASAVTLTRADLILLVEGSTEDTTPPAGSRDLTVEDVAERVGRATSTVRGWLIAGQLRGYKLNGRDWRVSPTALQDHMDAQSALISAPEPGDTGVDITEWRRVGN